MGERLKGKRAIITGAGSGIGAATAEVFVAEGAAVLLIDCNEDGVIATGRRISPDGSQTLTVCADISQEADIKGMIHTALDSAQY